MDDSYPSSEVVSGPGPKPSIARRVALATTFDRAASLAPEALLDRAASLFSRAAAPAQVAALILDGHLRGERLDGLLTLCERRRELPVLALEAASGLHARPALASLDREETLAAINETEGTMRRAAAVGAAYVIMRLGWVEGARRDWIFARDRFLRDALTPALRQGLLGARDRVAPGHLDRARAALDRLCRMADALGLVLLVKNGQRYVELPSPREADLLRGDLRGAPLDVLYDRPAAHLPEQMGLAPAALIAAAFGKGPLAYVGDACGALAALPPGAGELGAHAIPASLDHATKTAAFAFRPWPALRDEEIVAGIGKIIAQTG